MNPSTPSIRRNLQASAADGAAFGGMVGLGESYLAPFALAVGMSEVSAGLVASLPLVAGGTIQLVSLRAVRWIGSEKRWILICATLQALAFVPLVVAALAGQISLAALLLIASIYWGTGLATGPAWNTWVETVVPSGVRTRYFAARSRLAQLTTLAGLLIGGAILTLGGWLQRGEQAYAVMFALAGLLRLVSVYWLSQHHSLIRPRDAAAIGTAPGQPYEIRRSFVHGGRLLLFLVTLQGMVQLSGPFFIPYMLTELGFSYGQFVVLLSISFVTKAFSLSMWGRLTKRGGAKGLLWIGAIGVVPLSSLWMVSQSYAWLIVVQAISGVTWAAYELGFFLMFFEALPKRKRIRMLTIYNFANSAAIFVGATIGAWILRASGATVEGYLTLFGLSSIGRLLSLGILASASLKSVPVLEIAIRVLGLRIGSGSVDAPVLSSFEPDDVYRTEHRKPLEDAA
jgi:MFS family permease